MARLWRVYHPDLPEGAGDSFALHAEEVRHVRQVLRLGAGEPLAVFDGAGTEWRARIETSDPDRVVVRLDSPITRPVEPALALRLYQGLCKPERMDRVIEKATELGVAELFALKSGRAARQHAITPRRLTRWRRIGVEACKQSGRRRLPRIEVCEELPLTLPPGTLGLVLDPGDSAVPLGVVCRATPRPDRLWLAVGPESGFDAEELEGWRDAGWIRAGLGPRTLRADTAGLVAAAILLHLWGDLAPDSDPRGRC